MGSLGWGPSRRQEPPQLETGPRHGRTGLYFLVPANWPPLRPPKAPTGTLLGSQKCLEPSWSFPGARWATSS